MRDPKRHPLKAELCFRFRLARDLSMTVARLDEEMDARELIWWAEYYAAEGREHKRQAEEAARKARRGGR
jgi:hypothetical protein